MSINDLPLKMHLEAIGHRDAFEYMMTIASPDEPLTERRIKELHSLVLMSGAENREILAAEQMEALIADYAGMKRDKHIIEAIAEFHLRFEGIHLDSYFRGGHSPDALARLLAGYEIEELERYIRIIGG